MNQNTKSSFLFSIIIPIYNTEKYLKESIESVLKQDIGFTENVQLVLVNDGSGDGSGQICQEYAARFPENIKYIYQKNSGVSTARNTGIKESEGQYIGFLDADDKYSDKVCRLVADFFSNNKDVSVASMKRMFFGLKDNDHPLNNKFKGATRRVDVNIETETIMQSTVTDAFFRRDVIKNEQFDRSLRYGEDGKFVANVLLKHSSIGLVDGAVYFYRKREDQSSAVDKMKRSVEWYLDIIPKYLLETVNESKRLYGLVTRFVQNAILYDLKWRLANFDQQILSKDQQKLYLNLIKDAISNVDDEAIATNSLLSPRQKLYIFSIKYNQKVVERLNIKDGKVYFGDAELCLVSDIGYVFVELVRKQDNTLIIEGWHTYLFNNEVIDGLSVTYKSNNKDVKLENIEHPNLSIEILNTAIDYKVPFRVTVPITDESNWWGGFMLTYKENTTEAKVLFGRLSGLTEKINYSYKKISPEHIVSLRLGAGTKFTLSSAKFINVLRHEVSLLLRLIKQRDVKVLGVRLIAFGIKYLPKRKPIWIISDRPDRAGDNATYLFKYISSLDNPPIKAIFALSKQSQEYASLSELGRVIPFGNWYHKFLMFRADLMISAYFDEHIINLFGHRRSLYCGLLDDKFVYLQHGVLASDLSGLLSRYNKNARLIVASSTKEAGSIINNKAYGYTSREVAVGGQPRFDGVDESKKEKLVLFAPTWRLELAGEYVPVDVFGKGGYTKYNEAFKSSEYFKFYDRLINDKRLLKIFEENGYRGRLIVHPRLSEQTKDFHSNKLVEVITGKDYNEQLSKGALLVTDYSGVAFDFAYTKRPVVYAQYDRNDFYKGHTYQEGYYKFDSMGFGPVTFNYEETVQEIIASVSSQCKMDDMYKKRVEDFFVALDTKNSERTYNAIIQAEIEDGILK